MRALSIRQPWAWLIVNGHKDIENRVWASGYRGPLVIHAAKGMTRAEYEDVEEMLWLDRKFSGMQIKLPDMAAIERGGIVGIAEMAGSVTSSGSPWFFGPHGFLLRNARPLPFVPFKGQLGFFDVPNALIAPAPNGAAANPASVQREKDGGAE